MAQSILSKDEHNIVLISACAALGAQDALAQHLDRALDEGLTLNQAKELLIHCYAYAGFPRSLNALQTLEDVVKKRDLASKETIIGEEATSLSPQIDKNTYGERVRRQLVGGPTQASFVTFAPAIDQFLKEHLFADLFGREILTYSQRELATVAILSSLKGTESQLAGHLKMAENTGLSPQKLQAAQALVSRCRAQNSPAIFPQGEPNVAYAQYFQGQSFLQPLTKEGVKIANVTFEPGCRNNWHIHKEGGQILIVTQGVGYYQEWGKEPQRLYPGSVVEIPAGVKHWHGASPNSWFSHLAIEEPAPNATTQWLEPVEESFYRNLE